MYIGVHATRGGTMKRPSKKQMQALSSSPSNMKDKRVDLGKKVDLPKEDPKQLEYRTLQNIMFIITNSSTPMKDPTNLYQGAVALKEIFEYVVPKIQNLQKELGLDDKGQKIEKNAKKAKEVKNA